MRAVRVAYQLNHVYQRANGWEWLAVRARARFERAQGEAGRPHRARARALQRPSSTTCDHKLLSATNVLAGYGR